MRLDELGRDLFVLADIIRDDAAGRSTACAKAGRRLSRGLVGAEPADRELLARVVRIPLERLDEWLDDTISLLANADGTMQRRLAAAARVETIGWAWAGEPPSWDIQPLREAWRAEHRLP